MDFRYAAGLKCKSPSVDWTALQIILERADADVLIVLDCYCPVGSKNVVDGEFHEGGRTKILAASGYNLKSNGESTKNVHRGVSKENLQTQDVLSRSISPNSSVKDAV